MTPRELESGGPEETERLGWRLGRTAPSGALLAGASPRSDVADTCLGSQLTVAGGTPRDASAPSATSASARRMKNARTTRRLKSGLGVHQVHAGPGRQVRPDFPHASVEPQAGNLGRAIGD